MLLCLLALVLTGTWKLTNFSNQSEKISVAPPSPKSNDITQPTNEPSRDWAEEEIAETKPTDPNLTPVANSGSPADLEEIRDWAKQYPADALSWISNESDGPRRDVVAEIVCLQLAQSNVAQAVALAERFGANCSGLRENLVEQWAEKDESAALSYAAGKPAGEERNHLLSRVAFVRSKQSPADAATLVAQQISPGETQDEAAISVLYQWALRDRSAALAWAQLFPTSGLRDRAIREVENVARANSAGRSAFE